MKSCLKIFLLAGLLWASSANASVTYRWKGDSSNPTELVPLARAQDIRFDITFTDEAVNSGSLRLYQEETSCNFRPGPCTTYLYGGVTEFHFGIGNVESWTVDSVTRPNQFNFYDIDVRFEPNGFLSGTIFAGNFETTFRMSSLGEQFMILAGSDYGAGLIIQDDTVYGVMERVPEPSTSASIGIAILAMAIVRRKGRRGAERNNSSRYLALYT